MGRSSARTDAGRSEQERGAEVSTIRSRDDRRERETRPDDQRKSCHLCGKKSEGEGGKMRKTNAGGVEGQHMDAETGERSVGEGRADSR